MPWVALDTTIVSVPPRLRDLSANLTASGDKFVKV